MALAEILKITHSVRDEVKVVDSKVESAGDKMEDIGRNMQCVDEKVQVVIDGARGVSSQLPIHSNIYIFRQRGGKSCGKGSNINYPTDHKQYKRN